MSAISLILTGIRSTLYANVSYFTAARSYHAAYIKCFNKFYVYLCNTFHW